MTTVFYNAACSKCRRVREILEERGEPYELVEYLKHPPDLVVLDTILERLDAGAEALVRRDEAFTKLGVEVADLTRERVAAVLLAHPELLERPVVLRGARAIVARPPERIFELLD
jgi:arsenate reductase (glutaredoxin)